MKYAYSKCMHKVSCLWTEYAQHLMSLVLKLRGLRRRMMVMHLAQSFLKLCDKKNKQWRAWSRFMLGLCRFALPPHWAGSDSQSSSRFFWSLFRVGICCHGNYPGHPQVTARASSEKDTCVTVCVCMCPALYSTVVWRTGLLSVQGLRLGLGSWEQNQVKDWDRTFSCDG